MAQSLVLFITLTNGLVSASSTSIESSGGGYGGERRQERITLEVIQEVSVIET